MIAVESCQIETHAARHHLHKTPAGEVGQSKLAWFNSDYLVKDHLTDAVNMVVIGRAGERKQKLSLCRATPVT
jgi:hypothetical protein